MASRLSALSLENPIVVAVPNGGVPVGAVIAQKLPAALHLMVVRKLQLPDNPEAGFGALTWDGFLLLNRALIHSVGLSEREILTQQEKAEQSIRTRLALFGKWAVLPPLEERVVILVDDGLASGFTMEAAAKSIQKRGPKGVIIAVPTSSMTAFRRLESLVDQVVCPELSRLRIFAVANAYENWYDLNEEEVLRILESMSARGVENQ